MAESRMSVCLMEPKHIAYFFLGFCKYEDVRYTIAKYISYTHVNSITRIPFRHSFVPIPFSSSVSSLMESNSLTPKRFGYPPKG